MSVEIKCNLCSFSVKSDNLNEALAASDAHNAAHPSPLAALGDDDAPVV